MNPQQSSEKPCPEKLQPFLQRLADPAGDQIDYAALEELLASDEQVRRYYYRYMALHAQLQLLGESPRSTPLSSSPDEALAVTRDDAVKPTVTLPRLSVLLALLTISLVLAILAIVKVPNFRMTSVDERPIAQLNALHKCVWAEGMLPLREGAELRPGAVLELTSGQVEVAFGDVAEVVVIGPSRFVLDSAGSCTLDSGKAVAEVPDSATGFTIHTPTATVVDFGTRFAVSVDENTETEVHVFEGEIAVQPRSDRDEGSQGGVRHISAGAAVRVGVDNLLSDIKCDPRRFVRRTPNVALAYAHQGGGLLRSDGRVVLGGNTRGVRRIGASSEQNISLVSIFMLRLPEIQDPNAIESAKLAFTYKSMDGDAEFAVDLYGLGYVESATTDPDWFYEGDVGREADTRLAEAVLTPDSPQGRVIVDSVAVADFLATLYREGAKPGDLAVFRLNAAVETKKTTRETGYNVVHAPVVSGHTLPHEIATLRIVLRESVASEAVPVTGQSTTPE